MELHRTSSRSNVVEMQKRHGIVNLQPLQIDDQELVGGNQRSRRNALKITIEKNDEVKDKETTDKK